MNKLLKSAKKNTPFLSYTIVNERCILGETEKGFYLYFGTDKEIEKYISNDKDKRLIYGREISKLSLEQTARLYFKLQKTFGKVETKRILLTISKKINSSKK